jgi:hypothetical protein
MQKSWNQVPAASLQLSRKIASRPVGTIKLLFKKLNSILCEQIE